MARTHSKAEAHLTKVCPLMRRAVAKVGPCQLELQPKRQPYESLMRAVAHQQLNGRAAETILGRFGALYPRGRFPSPRAVLATDAGDLRAVGFSHAKVRALHDIALKAESGLVPGRAEISRMEDAAIIERLTQVRGVGRWTVEMLLIFQLGRPDVLPVDDFGVAKGFGLLKKMKEHPKPRQLAEWGQRWAPYRTVASWYLWRVADGG